jgi:hypothetical protein
MQIKFQLSSAQFRAIVYRFLHLTMRGTFLYLNCPYVNIILIYVQFSTLNLKYVLMNVRRCMKNLTYCLRTVYHSPIATPATKGVQQNVTRWLSGSTVCEYYFSYVQNTSTLSLRIFDVQLYEVIRIYVLTVEPIFCCFLKADQIFQF